MEYHAALHTVREKIRLFEQKYSQPWSDFKQRVEHAAQEDFSQWDDYIEWKAQMKMFSEISVKLEEVRAQQLVSMEFIGKTAFGT